MSFDILRRMAVKVLQAIMMGITSVLITIWFVLYLDWLYKSEHWQTIQEVTALIISIIVPILITAAFVQMYQEAKEESGR